MSFPESTPYPEASQASTALVLSIVGLVCCQVLGIVAWIMANNELEAIKAGRRNPANEGTASAARIIGIVATVLLCVGVVLLIISLIAGLAMVPWSEEFWREEMFN
jgi:ABC-type Fe3+ transport system permease subunit